MVAPRFPCKPALQTHLPLSPGAIKRAFALLCPKLVDHFSATAGRIPPARIWSSLHLWSQPRALS
jgi:hypothetical protein